MAIVYETEYSGKSKFGLAIESTIKMLSKKKLYSDISKDTVCKELSSLISDLTDGNVTVTIGAFDFVNAWAKIPLLDNGNPMITNSITTATSGIDGDLDYTRFKKFHPDLIGGFDLKKNKFTGWAKKLKIELCLGYRCIHPKKSDVDMNPMVATFILLHEFGHIVEKILGTGNTVRESYILSQAHHRLMNTTDRTKRIKIMRDIIREERLKDGDDVMAALKDEVSDETLYTVTIGAIRGEVRSELDSYGYDQTASESLADYYAVKQGYGAGALYLARDNNPIISHDDMQYIASYILIFSPAIAAGSAPIFGIGVLASLAMTAIGGYSYDTMTNRYDNSYDRLQRATNAYIESVKSSEISPRPEEIAEIKKLQTALKSMNSDQRGVLQTIYEYVNPRGRKERNSKSLQKAMESLSNHSLSIKAREYMGS